MALTLINVQARSATRARAFFSGGDPSTQPVSAFALARQDGGPNTSAVKALFLADTEQLELVLSEPLLAGVAYTITWSAMVVAFTWDESPNAPATAPVHDDPEAEVFGVDVAWLFSEPTADGDCPQRRGIDCYKNDMQVRALLKKGELVHLPSAGADLPDDVNSPGSTENTRATAAKLKAEFLDDDRTADADVTVTDDGDGGFEYEARLKPVAIGGQIVVSNT